MANKPAARSQQFAARSCYLAMVIANASACLASTSTCQAAQGPCGRDQDTPCQAEAQPDSDVGTSIMMAFTLQLLRSED